VKTARRGEDDLNGAPLLSVRGLTTAFNTESGPVRAVEDVSFDVRRGETLGIVGESGCGKSVTALSILRLLPKPAGFIEAGQILFDGIDITALTPARLHRIRGNRISMIFQEPMTALNPVHTIGKQLAEAYRLHRPEMSEAEIQTDSLHMLHTVSIPSPKRRLQEYPHQISGGMRQRVMIAMAMACRPQMIIADEPTTALDVTIQAQILELMKQLQRETRTAIVFITHDLGVIAEMCDTVLVMYAGQIVEKAPVSSLFERPLHPYTQGLMGSIPRLNRPRKVMLATISGTVPGLSELPDGCRFQNRCAYAMPGCAVAAPPLLRCERAHDVGCWLYRRPLAQHPPPSATRRHD
jgi:oligopeptide/dipeptide ABC transporter ATP-binding protein